MDIKVNPENEKLLSRLQNYKFTSAQRYYENETQAVRRVIDVLATMFGDCGWIAGDINFLIWHTLHSLGVVENDDDDSD